MHHIKLNITLLVLSREVICNRTQLCSVFLCIKWNCKWKKHCLFCPNNKCLCFMLLLLIISLQPSASGSDVDHYLLHCYRSQYRVSSRLVHTRFPCHQCHQSTPSLWIQQFNTVLKQTRIVVEVLVLSKAGISLLCIIFRTRYFKPFDCNFYFIVCSHLLPLASSDAVILTVLTEDLYFSWK